MSKIELVISAFCYPDSLRTLLSCLIDQRYEDWSALVMDNADDEEIADKHQELIRMDPRISYYRSSDRCFECYDSANLGAKLTESEWVGFPSDDSYYVRWWYLTRMMRCAEETGADFVFCDMVHGYQDYTQFPVEKREEAAVYSYLSCEPRACHIDKTNFLVKRSVFNEVGGFDAPGARVTFAADGPFVDKVVRAGYRTVKVPHLMCVHNP
jgi:GT2 family glycosyltransferase